MPDVEQLATRRTNPRGWSDHEFLHGTWDAVQAMAKEQERQGGDLKALKRLLVELDRNVVAGFKRFGLRLRNAEERASQSQIDAEEAKKTASEVESTALRTFVEDAKPFGRWRRDLFLAALGVAGTLAAAALAHACGFTLLG